MKIIEGSRASINNLSKGVVISQLKEDGIILLRNFDVTVEAFSGFIGSICSRVTNDPARMATAKNTQLIDNGDMKMGLHLENGNAPFIPHFQFFYAEKAPLKLSRTTYCDGFEAYQHLEKAIAEELYDRQIMYTRDIHPTKWKKYFSVELQREVGAFADILPFVSRDVQLIEKENQYIQWRIRRNIVYDSFLSGLRVLAHCIFGPSINYEIPNLTWSDGSMIRSSILDSINIICEKLTKPIQYQDGDVVVLDNHRVMHGRERVLDHKRKIYGGQGYI